MSYFRCWSERNSSNNFLYSRCGHSGSGRGSNAGGSDRGVVYSGRHCCRDRITVIPSRVRIEVDHIIGQNLVGKIISSEPPVGHAANHSASADRHRRRGVTATSRSQIKALSSLRDVVEAGGLDLYGRNIMDVMTVLVVSTQNTVWSDSFFLLVVHECRTPAQDRANA